MTDIQIILIFFSLLVAAFASLIFRARLWYRLLAIFFFLGATCFVLFPNATNVIAHHLGVGRGADLLLYMNVFATVHGFLLLYAKTRKLEQKLTTQVRSLAIRDAQFLSPDFVSEGLRSRSAAQG